MSGRAVRSLVAWCALVAIAAPFSAAVANIACDKPADIVHGNWSWVNSITIVYSCQPGFLLGGLITRTCKSGSWYPHYPPYCTVVCQRPPLDSNADMSALAREKTYFTSGETVLFTCHDRNMYTLLCDRGRWRPIGRNRKCKDVNCGILTVANAVCTQDRVAKCSCNDGYVLVGSPNVTCQANGRWSDNHPECKPRACKELPHVHGGQKEGDGGTVGNTVHFKCNEGFRLEGESTLTCLETKEWSSPPPACDPFCGKPPPQRHAQLAVAYGRRELYRVDQYAYFYCDEYYRYPSPGFYLTCKEEGGRTTWDTDHRRCNPQRRRVTVTLSDLNEPPEASSHRTTASRLRLARLATYGEECARPDQIPNGKWEGNVTIGSSITYSCDEHFRVEGERTLTCLETKEWSSPPPACDPFCGKPPPQRHAQLAVAYDRRELYRVDQYAYFYCDEYYRAPSPGFYLTCKQEGGRTTWDTDHRRCNREECERPDQIPNGKWEGNVTTGSSITYSCDEHFRMQGNRTLVCLYNHQWSSSPPACQPFCGKPPPQPHAKLSPAYDNKQQYFENQTVHFDCDEDYKSPSDGFDLYCRRKGDLMSWDADHKRCNREECERPAKIPNGKWEGNVTTGSSITYSCDEHFTLQGNRTLVCLYNQRWLSSPPACQPFCGKPPPQPHAKLSPAYDNKQQYFENQTVHFDCDEDYKSPSDGFDLYCRRKGDMMAWDVDHKWCNPSVCGTPPDQPHAKVKIPAGHVHGRRYDVHEYVYVACDDRFKSLASGYYMSCEKDGGDAAGWVVGSYLGCTPELCYAPGEVEHGFWSGNITLGGSIEFSCQKHFTLRGASKLTCDSTTKKWSSTAPRCEQTSNATQSSNHSVGETPRQGSPTRSPTQRTSSPTHEVNSTAQVQLPWDETVSPNQPRAANQPNQPRLANQPLPPNQPRRANQPNQPRLANQPLPAN
ncbi:sushi, von Willebrand factor type A, EGF and pentraxin domain-containing protein 1-like isoform X3 [Lampetra fluviatilis]